MADNYDIFRFQYNYFWISDILRSKSILDYSVSHTSWKTALLDAVSMITAIPTNHIIVSFFDVLHTAYDFQMSYPCSKGKTTLFLTISYPFWGWFWPACSMGKMTKNGLNGGKWADLKKNVHKFNFFEHKTYGKSRYFDPQMKGRCPVWNIFL